MSKIISKIFIVLTLTLLSAFIFNDFDLQDNIILFIFGYGLLYFWSLLYDRTKIIKITKESDEILHPVTQIENTLHIINIQKHYGKEYNPKFVETCDCGSTLFRIYNEDTDKGTFIQFICTKCNRKATGFEFNWKQKV